MGYYMKGDYYRGDYYRGDPFIGALIGRAASALGVGKLAAKAGKFVLSKLTPKVVKTATGVVVTGATAGAAGTMIDRAYPRSPSGNMPINIGPLGVDPVGMLPGGSPGFSWNSGGRRRYRRMNPLNPRALKRALRRAEGFEKFAKQTVNALYRTVDGRRVKTFKRTSRKGK